MLCCPVECNFKLCFILLYCISIYLSPFCFISSKHIFINIIRLRVSELDRARGTFRLTALKEKVLCLETELSEANKEKEKLSSVSEKYELARSSLVRKEATLKVGKIKQIIMRVKLMKELLYFIITFFLSFDYLIILFNLFDSIFLLLR